MIDLWSGIRFHRHRLMRSVYAHSYTHTTCILAEPFPPIAQPKRWWANIPHKRQKSNFTVLLKRSNRFWCTLFWMFLLCVGRIFHGITMSHNKWHKQQTIEKKKKRKKNNPRNRSERATKNALAKRRPNIKGFLIALPRPNVKKPCLLRFLIILSDTTHTHTHSQHQNTYGI